MQGCISTVLPFARTADREGKSGRSTTPHPARGSPELDDIVALTGFQPESAVRHLDVGRQESPAGTDPPCVSSGRIERALADADCQWSLGIGDRRAASGRDVLTSDDGAVGVIGLVLPDAISDVTGDIVPHSGRRRGDSRLAGHLAERGGRVLVGRIPLLVGLLFHGFHA